METVLSTQIFGAGGFILISASIFTYLLLGLLNLIGFIDASLKETGYIIVITLFCSGFISVFYSFIDFVFLR